MAVGDSAARPAIAGGKPAFEAFLVFGQPVLGDEEIEAVAEVIRSTWLGTGERVTEFEQAFAESVGALHAVALSSCTAALHASLVAAGIGSGDEVVTTPLTFVATAGAIVQAGASPVLVDIDATTLNIDPSLLERAMTSRTRAVMPVHFGGLPVDPEIDRIADAHGALVIEDAAHALGARVNGRSVGASGTACFSFYPNKNITTGEGGMVATDRPELAERLHSIRLHGLSRDAWERFRSQRVVFSEATMPGFKYNMIDLQAALGLVQLRRLPKFLELRRHLADIYDAELADVDGLRIQPRPWSDDLRHAHHLYVVEIEPAFGASRDDVLLALRHENIGAGVHYKPVHLHEYYGRLLGLGRGTFPVSERAGDRVISLPLSPAMSEDDVRIVSGALRSIQRYYARTT